MVVFGCNVGDSGMSGFMRETGKAADVEGRACIASQPLVSIKNPLSSLQLVRVQHRLALRPQRPLPPGEMFGLAQDILPKSRSTRCTWHKTIHVRAVKADWQRRRLRAKSILLHRKPPLVLLARSAVSSAKSLNRSSTKRRPRQNRDC
jgi:hypothetical protein